MKLKFTVINELEGLSKGLKLSNDAPFSSNSFTQVGVVPIMTSIAINSVNKRNDTEHALKVAEASKTALTYLKTKPVAVKLVFFKSVCLTFF